MYGQWTLTLLPQKPMNATDAIRTKAYHDHLNRVNALILESMACHRHS